MGVLVINLVQNDKQWTQKRRVISAKVPVLSCRVERANPTSFFFFFFFFFFSNNSVYFFLMSPEFRIQCKTDLSNVNIVILSYL